MGPDVENVGHFGQLQHEQGVKNDGSELIITNDWLETLRRCDGYYMTPFGQRGELLGPLVGYTASYESEKDGKKWVGFAYLNFSMADQWPAVLKFFACRASKLLAENEVEPNMIVGAPWAGVKFSMAVAMEVGCRHIFAEKKGDDLVLGRYDGMIRHGDEVVIGEELVNNASTTGRLIKLIEDRGAKVIAIVSAVNRSYPFISSFSTADGRKIPILSVIVKSTPQFRQDAPEVVEAIRTGNIIWKPKYDWEKLKAVMAQFA